MYSNAGLGYCCLSREAGEINGGNIVWNFWWIEAFFFSRDERKKLENFFVRVLFILIFLYLCIYDYII